MTRDDLRYVCGACGKISRDRWRKGDGTSPGWDESCSFNASLCRPRTAADTLVPEGVQWIAVDEKTSEDLAFTGDASRSREALS